MSNDKTMIRTRKNKTNPYVMLDKTGLNDSRLSWKAKGLHAYLMSLPDDWTIYIEELTGHARDGRDATRTAFKEMELAGYITNEAIRNKKGHITKWEKIVYEQPLHWDPFEMPSRKKKADQPDTENPFLDKNDEKPDTENPDLDNPLLENPTLLNNDLTNKKSTKEELNNNNKKGISKVNKPDQKDILSTDAHSVVVDLLDKHGIHVNKSTLTRWMKEASEETIIQAAQDAIKRDDVENVVGYITRMLKDGYTAPTGVQKAVSAPKHKGLPEYVVRQLEEAKQEAAVTSEELSEKDKREAMELLRALGEID